LRERSFGRLMKIGRVYHDGLERRESRFSEIYLKKRMPKTL